MNISKEKKYEMKKQISLLSVFCTQAPSKNRCLKNATIHDNGFLITRLGLVEQHQNGVIANSSFKGGVIFNTITVKGTYYLQYYVDNSFLPRSLKLRKTRLFVMSGEWKSYEPIFVNGKPTPLPFFSQVAEEILSLHKKGKAYFVYDKKGREYPFYRNQITGLTFMKVGKKTVPLLEGNLITPVIANMVKNVERDEKMVMNNVDTSRRTVDRVSNLLFFPFHDFDTSLDDIESSHGDFKSNNLKSNDVDSEDFQNDVDFEYSNLPSFNELDNLSHHDWLDLLFKIYKLKNQTEYLELLVHEKDVAKDEKFQKRKIMLDYLLKFQQYPLDKQFKEIEKLEELEELKQLFKLEELGELGELEELEESETLNG
jgi:hypothetical protein